MTSAAAAPSSCTGSAARASRNFWSCPLCRRSHPLCTAPPPRETQDEDVTLHTLRTLIPQNVWNNGARGDSTDVEWLDVLTDEDPATPPPRPPLHASTWALPDPGADPTIYVSDSEHYDDAPRGSVPPIGNLPDSWGPVTPMNCNNYRTTVVTLTSRLPFAFSWLVGDAEWAMGIVRGAHGGEWGEFFHRGGAMTPGATERLMGAYLTWRGIPLPRNLQPLAQLAQQPRVPPPQPGPYGNAAVARMIARGTRLDGSSSSSRRTATITTPPPRSRATTATRATNLRARAPPAATSSTSSGPSTSAPPTPVATRHQQRAADATRTTNAPAPLRAGTPQSPRQERASKQAAQRNRPHHHPATGIQGHQASRAGSGAVPSPTNTGAVGTLPEQPPSTANPHRKPTLSHTARPGPQTPPGASAHGHQPAAGQAAATQAHPEPRPRHGTPDRPTAGPAYAPQEDPPTQEHAATPTDTATTRPSDTVCPHTHDPTEGPDPQAPATASTGDLPATTHAGLAPQRHHAPATGPTAGPAKPSSPGRPAPRPDPGPDPARTTALEGARQLAGPGSRPGSPPVSEDHAREAAQPANDEAAPPALPTQPQRGVPTVGAEEMRGPPQWTAPPTPVEEPGGGVNGPEIQHADPPNMAAHGSNEASAAGQPDTEPEGPMPDTEGEAGLRPPSARGAQPTGRACAAPLANIAHHADASTPGETPPRDPTETRATSETGEATPDTPQRAAGRETSPSGHNRDDDAFNAFMESCMGDLHTVPTPAAPGVHPEPRRDHAGDTPLTIPRQAHPQRDYTALGRTRQVTAPGEGHAAASGAADRTIDERSAAGSGARVEAGTNTAGEPTGPPPGTAPPGGQGHLDYARLEGEANRPSDQAEQAAARDLGIWIPRLTAGEQLTLAVRIRWLLSSRSRHLAEGTRTMADITFDHRAGYTPPATMDHPGQWHYVATQLMAHMGAYNPDEMNGLPWQWHQRAALRIRAIMQEHNIWDIPGSRATKDTPQANGGRGPKTSQSLPDRRRAVTPQHAQRGHHPEWVPPLAHTEAPYGRLPRAGARAVLTPWRCTTAHRNDARRRGTLADPVAAAARCLPQNGESSSMRVWTGTTGVPASPTPYGHHLPPIPDAGPRSPASNGRTSPPFSRQSSASDRQRFTRAPTGRQTERPAHPPAPSQGRRLTRCRGDHTPWTRGKGSLRPTQGLRKGWGDSPPNSLQTAKARRAHRNNGGAAQTAQGRTQK